MKLTDKKGMSRWAYNQCRDGNDTPEIRDLITKSVDAYYYCRHIKDTEEIWNRITERYWAKWYCKCVKDRPKVRKYIK